MPTPSNPDPFTQLLADARERDAAATKDIVVSGIINLYAREPRKYLGHFNGDGTTGGQDNDNAIGFAFFRNSGPTLADIAEMAVEAIKDAPHGEFCSVQERTPCTCWKSRILSAIQTRAGGHKG